MSRYILEPTPRRAQCGSRERFWCTLERPGGTARNVFGGAIEEMVPEPPAGELTRVSLSTTPPLIAEVTRGAVESLGLRLGMQVFASFKAAGVVAIR